MWIKRVCEKSERGYTFKWYEKLGIEKRASGYRISVTLSVITLIIFKRLDY